jgi:hypothetical protein
VSFRRKPCLIVGFENNNKLTYLLAVSLHDSSVTKSGIRVLKSRRSRFSEDGWTCLDVSVFYSRSVKARAASRLPSPGDLLVMGC